MPARRAKQPSRAVALGGTLGTILGGTIEAVAAANGVVLPPGTGATLGGALATLFAYVTRGGRRGEAD